MNEGELSESKLSKFKELMKISRLGVGLKIKRYKAYFIYGEEKGEK